MLLNSSTMRPRQMSVFACLVVEQRHALHSISVFHGDACSSNGRPPACTSIFQADPPARLLLHEIPYANDKLRTSADFALCRSCDVFAVATGLESCRKESGLVGDPRPHGARHIDHHLPLFFKRAAYPSDHSPYRLNRSLKDPVALRTSKKDCH